MSQRPLLASVLLVYLVLTFVLNATPADAVLAAPVFSRPSNDLPAPNGAGQQAGAFPESIRSAMWRSPQGHDVQATAPLHRAAAPSENFSDPWWAAAQKSIRQSEYDVTWQDHTYLPDLPAVELRPQTGYHTMRPGKTLEEKP